MKNKRMILGLCGKPQVGKSEVTKILVRDHNFSLLDSKEILRKMTSLVSGVYPESLRKEGYKLLRYKGVSNRKIMGEIGKTLESLFGEDFLIHKALESGLITPGARVVVDSLRMDQGVNFPGKVIEVYSSRPYDGPKFDFDEYNRAPVIHTIDNSRGIPELEENIKQMILDLSSQDK